MTKCLFFWFVRAQNLARALLTTMRDHPDQEMVSCVLGDKSSFNGSRSKREPFALSEMASGVQDVVNRLAGDFSDYMDNFEMSSINAVQSHMDEEGIFQPLQKDLMVEQLILLYYSKKA